MKLNYITSFLCGFFSGAAGYLLLKNFFKRRNSSIRYLLFSPQDIHRTGTSENCGAMACSLCNLHKLCSLLKTTKFELEVCVYLITEPSIIETIAKLHRKGVKVRVIVDKQMTQELFKAKVGPFFKYNVPAKYLLVSGMMHNKFAIIDKKIVITGSANWTPHGFFSNDENMVIIQDTEVAKAYLNYFNDIWAEKRIVQLSVPYF